MRVNNGLTPQELEAYGISDVHDIVYNPSYDLLYQEELDPSLTGYERGVLTNLGAVAVDTGIFTGRSPKDKYIVRDDTTRDTFWWADKGKGKNDNKPLSPETWQHLKGLVTRRFPANVCSLSTLSVVRTRILVFPSVSSPKWPGRRILSKTCLFARAMKSWQVSNQTLSL